MSALPTPIASIATNVEDHGAVVTFDLTRPTDAEMLAREIARARSQLSYFENSLVRDRAHFESLPESEPMRSFYAREIEHSTQRAAYWSGRLAELAGDVPARELEPA